MTWAVALCCCLLLTTLQHTEALLQPSNTSETGAQCGALVSNFIKKHGRVATSRDPGARFVISRHLLSTSHS